MAGAPIPRHCIKVKQRKTIETKLTQTDQVAFLAFFCSDTRVSDKLTSIQDNCDEGGDRPNGPHHPHPLRVLPLHELVRGQGGHLQRAHRQVLAHIHGDEPRSLDIWKSQKQFSRDLSFPR